MKHYTPRIANGFTLIEMAIVLILIALSGTLITSVSTFFQSSKEKRILSELQYYQQAIISFRDQYKGWPGDWPGAYNMWGADCGGDASSDTGGCNGDGDRFIEWGNAEGVKAWQHLQLADMISTTPPMSGTITSNEAVIGSNVPASKIDDVGYYLYTDTDGHQLLAGSEVTLKPNYGPILPPSAARSMDNKIDDGNPETGLFRSRGTTDCFSGENYNLEEEGDVCAVKIILQY